MEATGARRGSAFLRWWRRCRCRPWMAGAGSAPGQGCGTTPAGCARRGEEEEEEEEREGLGPQGRAGVSREGGLRRAAAEGTPGVWPAPRPVAAARALQRCLLGSPPPFFFGVQAVLRFLSIPSLKVTSLISCCKSVSAHPSRGCPYFLTRLSCLLGPWPCS